MRFRNEVLKQYRNDKKLSQAQLAKIIGIAQPYYNSIERGLAIPRTGTSLPLIAKALGLGEFDLFEPEITSSDTPQKRSKAVSPFIANNFDVSEKLCDLIQAIREVFKECDTPEEVMRLLLDAGDDGVINHPENEKFLSLIEELLPTITDFIKNHNERRTQNARAN